MVMEDRGGQPQRFLRQADFLKLRHQACVQRADLALVADLQMQPDYQQQHNDRHQHGHRDAEPPVADDRAVPALGRQVDAQHGDGSAVAGQGDRRQPRHPLAPAVPVRAGDIRHAAGHHRGNLRHRFVIHIARRRVVRRIRRFGIGQEDHLAIPDCHQVHEPVFGIDPLDARQLLPDFVEGRCAEIAGIRPELRHPLRVDRRRRGGRQHLQTLVGDTPAVGGHRDGQQNARDKHQSQQCPAEARVEPLSQDCRHACAR
jgi:hypothetical protein